MTESKKRAVIWDMDGVIADTGTYHLRSWQHVFRERGIDFGEDEFKKRFGQRNDTIVRAVMGGSVSEEEINAVASEKEEYYRRAVCQNVRALPGVVHLLRSLRQNGYVSAIGSSAPPENISIILEGLKIAEMFEAICYGREVKEGKPSPQIFLMAAQKLKIDSANCVVIEDSMAGVTAAKRAGMACIAVTNSHPASQLTEADLIVSSLEKVTVRDLENLISKRKS
jgi:beta-phosphoglucomutase family hydrolase